MHRRMMFDEHFVIVASRHLCLENYHRFAEHSRKILQISFIWHTESFVEIVRVAGTTALVHQMDVHILMIRALETGQRIAHGVKASIRPNQMIFSGEIGRN